MKKIGIIFLLISFIPIIALILYPFGYSVSLFGLWDLSVLASIIWLAASIIFTVFYLLVKSHISKAFKITGLLITSFFSVILVLFSALIIFMSHSIQNTVVERIASPENTRFAEIVDSDQGALGGNTVIYVKDTHKTDFLLFSVRKNKRIYVGEWREYENMRIEWISENCLKINSEEYIIE